MVIYFRNSNIFLTINIFIICFAIAV